MRINKANQQTIELLEIEVKSLNEKLKLYEKEKLKLMESLTDFEMNTKCKLEMNLKKYKSKYKRCKTELKSFDVKFFDDIEDLKYYLSEAVKLNKYYEGLLHINTDKTKEIIEFNDRIAVINKSIDIKRNELIMSMESYQNTSFNSNNDTTVNDEDESSFNYNSADQTINYDDSESS